MLNTILIADTSISQLQGHNVRLVRQEEYGFACQSQLHLGVFISGWGGRGHAGGQEENQRGQGDRRWEAPDTEKEYICVCEKKFSDDVTQAVLKLMCKPDKFMAVFLPRRSGCWNHRHESPCLAQNVFLWSHTPVIPIALWEAEIRGS